VIALPSGRRGQALAVALTLVVLAVVWLGAVAPLFEWYDDRAAYLAQQRVLATRMAAVAATAPALQRQLADADSSAPPSAAVFEGATDAIAGAALQQAVQDRAAQAGAIVLSAEMLPPSAAGAYQRIGLHVLVSAPWPVLIALLDATLTGTPRMVVDDLTLRETLSLGKPDTHPLEAGFTVTAFHAVQSAR
jgi:general secretion pathway protein M